MNCLLGLTNKHSSYTFIHVSLIYQSHNLCICKMCMLFRSVQLFSLYICKFHLLLSVNNFGLKLCEGLLQLQIHRAAILLLCCACAVEINNLNACILPRSEDSIATSLLYLKSKSKNLSTLNFTSSKNILLK